MVHPLVAEGFVMGHISEVAPGRHWAQLLESSNSFCQQSCVPADLMAHLLYQLRGFMLVATWR